MTLDFFRRREWTILRRLILVGLIVFLALRNYGDSLTRWFARPDGARDVVLTQYEFRPEMPGAKPAWIIGFRNESARFTYDRIELEATYFDDQGAILQQDKLVVNQRLAPGEEQLVASIDARDRPGASKGTLRVSHAERVE
jgi:hypothetical protein